MSAPDEVTELALAAGRGDRIALSEFIRRTQADVWRYVSRLSHPNLADDLTQETYLRVLSALAAFEGRSSARVWLLAIARRVVVDRIRHDRARPQLFGGDSWFELKDSLPATTHFSNTLEVEELLSVLEPSRREALILTQLLGFSYSEAALISGCPVGTIRSRVARARTELVAAVERQRHEANVT
ncbi:MAG: sigma-70 family RNA polymerase sigma factor [Propionibacteriaceae bacterium]